MTRWPFLMGRCLYPNINCCYCQWHYLCHGNAQGLSWTFGSTEQLVLLLPVTGLPQGSLDSQRTTMHGYQIQLQINKLPNLTKSSLPSCESWNTCYRYSRSQPCSALDVAGAKCTTTVSSLAQDLTTILKKTGSVLLNAAHPPPLHSE